ncbi:hypothetical protein DXG01_008726 [Tephrocybe rancida]|nr:hypothetical protein DXG01_008726 [Tephrocybe rancida]
MLSGQASTYTSFFHELHQVKRPPWDTWDKSDWMCEQCITELEGTKSTKTAGAYFDVFKDLGPGALKLH